MNDLRDVTLGHVTRIDRANRILYATFPGYGPDEESPHTWIYEPIPLCLAAFVPGPRGDLVCFASAAGPEIVVDEHFAYNQTFATVEEGDGNWEFVITVGTPVPQSAVGVGALGVKRIQDNTGGSGILRKDAQSLAIPGAVNDPTTGALHLLARIRGNPQTVAGGGGVVDFISVGFGTFTALAMLQVTAVTPRAWQLVTSDLIVSNRTDVEGNPFVDDQWYYADLLVTRDAAAASIDGNRFTIHDGLQMPVDTSIFFDLNNAVSPNVRYVDVDVMRLTRVMTTEFPPTTSTLTIGAPGVPA